MLELLGAEWRRWRWGALGAGMLHLLLLVYLGRLTNLPQQSLSVLTLISLVYAVAGLLFGAWQMQGQRRPSAWLGLLHRPLAPAHIGLALSGAGAAVLAVGVLLPLLLALPVMNWMGRMVDSLHLGLALYAWLVALCGYLCGAAALLGPLWRGLPLLALPLLLLFDYLPLPWLLLPLALADLLLLALLLGRFRPDLEARPRGLGAVLLQGLPLAMVFAALLQHLLQLGVQAGLALLGSHPAQQPEGASSFEAWRFEAPASQLARLLPGLPAGWQPEDFEQARQLRLRSPGERLDQRHQAAATMTLNWAEPRRGWSLQFSHDRMQYRVADARGRLLGWLGPACLGEAQRFEQVPRPLGPGIAAGAQLWEWQDGRPCLQRSVQLPAHAGPLQQMLPMGADWLGLSAQALQRLTRGPDGNRQASWQLPLPAGVGAIDDLSVLRHPRQEDWLVRLVQGSHLEPRVARVDWYRIDAQGAPRHLGGRSLQPDFPDWFVWADWIIAPLINQAWTRYRERLAREFGAAHLLTEVPPRSARVQGLALGLALLAMLASFGLSRRHAAHPAWTLGALLLGPAWLPVQALLQPRAPERPMALGARTIPA